MIYLFIKVISMNFGKKVKLLKRNENNIDNLENILNRNNMEIQRQFGKTIPVYALTNVEAKNNFLTFLKQKYEIVMSSGNKYFKFLDTDDITTALKTIEHVVFFNTNPKYVLLMRTKIKNVNVYIYVFKSTSEVFVVNYKDNNGIEEHVDIVLEGEIVNNDTYLVSDLLVYDGMKNNEDVTVKKSKMEKIIDSINTNKGPSIKLKEFVSMCHCVSFVRDMLPKIKYKNIVNGLVFRPVSGARNKNIILILNKPFHNIKLVKSSSSAPATLQKNKIIFRENVKNVVCYGMKTSRGPDVIDLYFTNKRDELIKHGIAFVPSLKNSIEVQKIFENKNQTLVSCNIIPEENKLVIIEESEQLKASLIENISV
jgi:hypothetical protein